MLPNMTLSTFTIWTYCSYHDSDCLVFSSSSFGNFTSVFIDIGSAGVGPPQDYDAPTTSFPTPPSFTYFHFMVDFKR